MKRLDSGITKGIRLVIPYGFHSWVVGTVVSARDALENNGNLHEDVDGKVVATRDAFNNIGTFFEDVDGTVTSTRDAIYIVAPLNAVVALVIDS